MLGVLFERLTYRGRMQRIRRAFRCGYQVLGVDLSITWETRASIKLLAVLDVLDGKPVIQSVCS